ncbi:hypothetical protein RZS08_30400, partial [Arthrospira platensis SPKY1]|nr:hypothetical protein [Arthrospira platensis SPKY1]
MVGDTCAAGLPYSYQWNVSGGFILGDSTLSMVEVVWEDTAVLVTGLIIDTTNLCPLAVNIEIFAPVNCFPECEVALPEVLTCDISSITLDASGSSTGPEFVYAWNAISGNLCGGETTPFPCVDAPG